MGDVGADGLPESVEVDVLHPVLLAHLLDDGGDRRVVVLTYNGGVEVTAANVMRKPHYGGVTDDVMLEVLPHVGGVQNGTEMGCSARPDATHHPKNRGYSKM